MVTTPEFELVVLSTREFDASSRARLRDLVSGELNWESVMALAAGHAVTPLLYRVLSREVPRSIPSDIESRLRERCQLIAVENLISAGELDRVVRGFQREGIHVLCLKGATLA